jgi:hypothetical protein
MGKYLKGDYFADGDGGYAFEVVTVTDIKSAVF